MNGLLLGVTSRRFSFALAVLVAVGAGQTGDFESALESARDAADRHYYQRVIDILTPYNSLDDPEAEYVVAAEIGRANFHLGRYDIAYQAFRTAVRIHPDRAETAIFLEASSYLVGNTEQAFAIFRALLAGGAHDLYLAVTLPGATRFLAEPDVAELLQEYSVPLAVDISQGSVEGVEFGDTRGEVAEAMAAPMGDDSSSSLTAQAGPAVIWEYIFDDAQRLVEMVFQVEHLDLYTPYRLEIGDSDELQTTPAALIAALGSPTLTEARDDGDVAMEWQFENHRVVATFGPPRIRLATTPIGAATLRTLRLRAATPLPDTMVR